MRLMITATAVLLLTAAGTALAHDRELEHSDDHKATCGTHRLKTYEGGMTIDRAFYLQPGWWNGQKVAASESNPTDPSGGTSDGDDWKCGDSPAWLHLTTKTSTDVTYTVEVTVTGTAVGALDVFEYRDDDPGGEHEITPACPQHLVVDDLYPRSGEGADRYLFRVLHETVAGKHQRDQGVTMTVTLDPDESGQGPGERAGGFVVAIYPQAGSSEAIPEVTDEGGRIDWTITAEDSFFNIREIDEDDVSTQPLETSAYTSPPSQLFDCTNVPLPPVLQGGEPPELPSPPVDLAGQALLDTYLP